MNIRKLTAVAALAVGSTLLAATVPEVSSVTMSQDDSRLVTITYSLSNGPAIITLDIQTNATDDAWASIGGENIQYVTGDVWKKVETSTDTHTITWRPDLSWPDHKIAEGGARAVVTAWALDNPPDYMVVDLSAAAQKNTQCYYPAVEFLPGGLLGNDDYRMTKLVMRKIMAKDVEWTMGSAVTEIGRKENETAHTVKLDDNYYIAVFETTQAQWSYVQTTNPTPSYYTAERAMRPVERVCYNEIRNAANTTTANTTYDYPAAPNPDSFLGLLRTKTGLLFDLPSEAQWEFACRAGHGSGYLGDGSPILAYGRDENLALLGRFYYNGGLVTSSSSTALETPAGDCDVTNGTAIVGSYAPNDWGLYDMNGNVWELCLDWYEVNISAHGGAVNINPDNAAQTRSGNTGTVRVRRGGCWNTGCDCSRAAHRDSSESGARVNSVGFRLALPACVSGQQ